jgi:hypothetical protein
VKPGRQWALPRGPQKQSDLVGPATVYLAQAGAYGQSSPQSPPPAARAADRFDRLTVEQYAAQIIDATDGVADRLAGLAVRIAAHSDDDGFCGCGCNIQGWLEPFPCRARTFYEKVRDYLSAQQRDF